MKGCELVELPIINSYVNGTGTSTQDSENRLRTSTSNKMESCSEKYTPWIVFSL